MSFALRASSAVVRIVPILLFSALGCSSSGASPNGATTPEGTGGSSAGGSSAGGVGGSTGGMASSGTGGFAGASGSAGSAGIVSSSGGTTGSGGIAGSGGAGAPTGGTAGSGGTGVSTGGAAGSATGGLGGAAGSGGAWASYCQDAQAQYAACGELASFMCASPDCVASVWDASVIPSFASCLLARSCPALLSDDACADQVGYPGGPSAAQMADLATCAMKVNKCGSTGVSSDICNAATSDLVRPQIRTTIMTCFAGDCASLKACTDAALAPFACLHLKAFVGPSWVGRVSSLAFTRNPFARAHDRERSAGCRGRRDRIISHCVDSRNGFLRADLVCAP